MYSYSYATWLTSDSCTVYDRNCKSTNPSKAGAQQEFSAGNVIRMPICRYILHIGPRKTIYISSIFSITEGTGEISNHHIQLELDREGCEVISANPVELIAIPDVTHHGEREETPSSTVLLRVSMVTIAWSALNTDHLRHPVITATLTVDTIPTVTAHSTLGVDGWFSLRSSSSFSYSSSVSRMFTPGFPLARKHNC